MSWARFFQRGRRRREREAELGAHLALHVDELIARGQSPDEARRAARLAFGNPRVKLEELDQMNRLPVFDVLNRDLRYAVRVLARTPIFTVTAIATLAIVIGANTAVFSLANSILLRPLPYPEPDRLAMVMTHTRSPRGDSTTSGQDGPVWEAIRDRAPSIDAAVYSDFFSGGVNLVVGNQAEFADQQRVGSGYFRVLGVAPMIGREFTREEDLPNGPAAAILSYSLWERAFGGNRDIVGQRILLKGEPFTVVGVMPETFVNVWKADVWTPLRPNTTGEGGGTNYSIAARLRPGATWGQAEGEVNAIGAPSPDAPTTTEDGEPLVPKAEVFRLRGYGPATAAGLTLEPFQDVLTGGDREPILMLGAAVVTVLLIACVNLAALLLARGSSRSREIATRMALGSGRGAVVRQLMVEAIVLAIAGGAIGLLVGYLGLEALKSLGGTTFGDWEHVTLDSRVLAVTFGLSLVTSLVFGLAPALQASRLDVQATLSGAGTRSVAGSARRWPRRVLVASEVALGVVLLVAAGLLVRTFFNLRNLDPGFNPDDLVTASVSLQDARYATAESVSHLVDESVARLRATPGIEAAAVSLGLPYQRLLNLGVRLMDMPDDKAGVTVNATYVTPGYFETFGIAKRSGRVIEPTDRAGAAPIVVVNETFARVYSKDRAVLGRRVRLSGVEREIVGVVGDVQQAGSGFWVDGMSRSPIATTPLVYLPVEQTSDGFMRMVHTWFVPVWTVRAKKAGEAAAAIRAAIGSVDSLLPVTDGKDMAGIRAASMRQQRLMMTLVGAIAGVAVLLAALGIHGLIAHAVAERRREFGIRLALGATAGRTVREVALGGLLLALAGAAAGIVLSLGATRLISTFLVEGVTERDPVTYLAVAGFLVVVAGAASLVPALKILRLDPAETLRE